MYVLICEFKEGAGEYGVVGSMQVTHSGLDQWLLGQFYDFPFLTKEQGLSQISQQRMCLLYSIMDGIFSQLYIIIKCKF